MKILSRFEALKPLAEDLQGLDLGLIFPLRKSGQQKSELCELCGSSKAGGEYLNK
jgi:hypothetical protein